MKYEFRGKENQKGISILKSLFGCKVILNPVWFGAAFHFPAANKD
jgi:hypothetical protein